MRFGFKTPANGPIPVSSHVFTVAKDGSGDYKYIQDAIDAMWHIPSPRCIKNGVYNEKIELPATNTDVTFIGESVTKPSSSTIIRAGKTHTTFTCLPNFPVTVSVPRTSVSSIRPARRSGLHCNVDADKALFHHCRFSQPGYHLRSGETARQLFIGCYIEGTTDFIFGAATAVFSALYHPPKRNSYITAVITTPRQKYGFVFGLAASSPIHP